MIYNKLTKCVYEGYIMIENEAYLKEQIITYIGNKRKLLPYIEKEIEINNLKIVSLDTVNNLPNFDIFINNCISSINKII